MERSVTNREGEKSITVMVQPLEEINIDGGTEEAFPLGIQFLEEDMSSSCLIFIFRSMKLLTCPFRLSKRQMSIVFTYPKRPLLQN